LANGLDLFEPGAGGEHKRVRGFEPTLTYSSHWLAHRGLRNAIGSFLGREREAIAAHVRGEAAADDDEPT
jgi:predicted N-acyltransferase